MNQILYERIIQRDLRKMDSIEHEKKENVQINAIKSDKFE